MVFLVNFACSTVAILRFFLSFVADTAFHIFGDAIETESVNVRKFDKRLPRRQKTERYVRIVFPGQKLRKRD
jgi:hypothetical protein